MTSHGLEFEILRAAFGSLSLSFFHSVSQLANIIRIEPRHLSDAEFLLVFPRLLVFLLAVLGLKCLFRSLHLHMAPDLRNRTRGRQSLSST